MNRITVLVSTLSLFACGGTEADAASREVKLTSFGVAIVVPDGFVGAMAPDGSTFLMQSQAARSLIIAGHEKDTSLAKVEQAFAGPLAVDASTSLLPLAAPVRRGSTVTQRYSADTAEGKVAGFARATLRGKDAIGLIAVGPAEAAAELEAMLAEVDASVRVLSAAELGEGSKLFEARVRGRALKFFRTSGSLSTRHEVHLCADGSFASVFEDTFVAGDGSGNTFTEKRGTWRLEGAVLLLAADDGTTKRHTLAAQDGQLLLDGTRYFVVDGASCN